MALGFRLPVDEIVQFLRDRLFASDPSDLVALYHFGSSERGEARRDSDVDLAFLARHPTDAFRVFEAAQDLGMRIGRDIDLVDLSRSSTVFRAQVVATGRRVFTADPAAAETFEMYTLSDYARLQEERREVVQAFVDRYREK